MFGGNITEDREKSVIAVDKWVKFRSSSLKISVLVRALRLELDRVLAMKISHPELELTTRHPLIQAILLLLKEG